MAMKRRRFLQALGLGAGATLLGPLIHRAVADGATCRRFVIVVEGNGVYANSFLSDAARSAIEAAGADPIGDERVIHRGYRHDSPIEVTGDSLSTALCLGSLAPDASGVSLENRAAVVYGLSSKVSGGGHSSYFGALGCYRGSATTPAGPTIDSVLAYQNAGNAPFDAVRLGITASRNARLQYQTCAFGAGRPAPVITEPASAFNNLFGSVAAGSGAESFQQRSELLDYAREDVNHALGLFSGSSTERLKLERYLEALEQLTERQSRLSASRDGLLAVKPDDPEANPLYASAAPLDHLRAQFELATAALIGELTQVVVIASATGSGFSIDYPGIIDGVARHDLQHGSGGNPEFRAAIAEASRQHVDMIAQMARRLEATPDVSGGGGTMLDNTLILYMSDNGEKHHSNAEEWPMLLVGGDGLGFKTDGRTLVYPNYESANNRQVSNVFNTLGHAAGDTSLNDFGNEGPTRIAEGPLSEIWS
jgi:hypothetical protein